MALPKILFDSVLPGSDTLASGAGPATALTGTLGSTDAGGTVVTLADSPDLTNVATDGSHVIFLNDSTAGARNFGKITAKANSGSPTAQVTVADAFGTLLTTKSWAIGGRRATVGGTTSAKLYNNNSSNGDAMPGWTGEMQSGHSETLSANLLMRRAGDATSGPITLQGVSGAATLPLLTFSNNGNMLTMNTTNQVVQNFELRNTNATKTASIALAVNNAQCRVARMTINHATNKPWKGISISSGRAIEIDNCDIANCASHGISNANLTGAPIFTSNFIHANGGDGINHNGAANQAGATYVGNLITGNTGSGINDVRTGTVGTGGLVLGNVIHGNTVDGITISADGSTNTAPFQALQIVNNEITGNGGWGINLSGSPAQAVINGFMSMIVNNNFGTGATANTSGTLSTTTLDSSNLTVAPAYVATGSNNFIGGPAVWAKGYPTTAVGMNSGTVPGNDIGIQHSGAACLESPIMGNTYHYIG